MTAFSISMQDIDSYAFREYPRPPMNQVQRLHQTLFPDMSGESRPGIRRCEVCGEMLAKWDEPLTGLVVKKRKYDIGITYDSVTVVSERFRSTYSNNGLTGLVFRQLPNDPAFHAIHSTNIVAFDCERRKTRYGKQCPTCGQYEFVVIATPAMLKAGASVEPSAFAQTDVEFGSNDGKSPLLLCGETAAQVLNDAGLKGLIFEPVVPAENLSDEPADMDSGALNRRRIQT